MLDHHADTPSGWSCEVKELRARRDEHRRRVEQLETERAASLRRVQELEDEKRDLQLKSDMAARDFGMAARSLDIPLEFRAAWQRRWAHEDLLGICSSSIFFLRIAE